MKTIIRRLRLLENQFSPPVDEKYQRLVSEIRERRRHARFRHFAREAESRGAGKAEQANDESKDRSDNATRNKVSSASNTGRNLRNRAAVT